MQNDDDENTLSFDNQISVDTTSNTINGTTHDENQNAVATGSNQETITSENLLPNTFIDKEQDQQEQEYSNSVQKKRRFTDVDNEHFNNPNHNQTTTISSSLLNTVSVSTQQNDNSINNHLIQQQETSLSVSDDSDNIQKVNPPPHHQHHDQLDNYQLRIEWNEYNTIAVCWFESSYSLKTNEGKKKNVTNPMIVLQGRGYIENWRNNIEMQQQYKERIELNDESFNISSSSVVEVNGYILPNVVMNNKDEMTDHNNKNLKYYFESYEEGSWVTVIVPLGSCICIHCIDSYRKEDEEIRDHNMIDQSEEENNTTNINNQQQQKQQQNSSFQIHSNYLQTSYNSYGTIIFRPTIYPILWKKTCQSIIYNDYYHNHKSNIIRIKQQEIYNEQMKQKQYLEKELEKSQPHFLSTRAFDDDTITSSFDNDDDNDTHDTITNSSIPPQSSFQIVFCGGKSVGKSTCLRYFINQFLSYHHLHQQKQQYVLVLDADPGQPEFVLPGMIGLVLISTPILYPPHRTCIVTSSSSSSSSSSSMNQMLQQQSSSSNHDHCDIIILKSYFIGSVTTDRNPQLFLKYLELLVEKYYQFLKLIDDEDDIDHDHDNNNVQSHNNNDNSNNNNEYHIDSHTTEGDDDNDGAEADEMDDSSLPSYYSDFQAHNNKDTYKLASQSTPPLLVNMNGWIKDFGYEILLTILQTILVPNHIIQILSNSAAKQFDLSSCMNGNDNNIKIHCCYAFNIVHEDEEEGDTSNKMRVNDEEIFHQNVRDGDVDISSPMIESSSCNDDNTNNNVMDSQLTNEDESSYYKSDRASLLNGTTLFRREKNDVSSQQHTTSLLRRNRLTPILSSIPASYLRSLRYISYFSLIYLYGDDRKSKGREIDNNIINPNINFANFCHKNHEHYKWNPLTILDTFAFRLSSALPYAVSMDSVEIRLMDNTSDLKNEHSIYASMNGAMIGLCCDCRRHHHNDDDDNDLVQKENTLDSNEHLLVPCVGLGIVRSIDINHRMFYILTPCSPDVLKYVTILMVSTSGDMTLPVQECLFEGLYSQSFPYQTFSIPQQQQQQDNSDDKVQQKQHEVLGHWPMRSRNSLQRR